jgi:DNA-binding response OmpR family regulator
MEEGTILLIENDQQIKELLIVDVLQPLGVQPLIASTGKEGLEKALLLSPVLILVGETLPDLSTLEFLSVLRQSTFTSPVVLLTVDQNPSHLIEAFEQGISDFLLLPFNSGQAKQTIQRVLKMGLEQHERDKSNNNLRLVEAIQITITTLSHYLNNYITALNGDLTLLQEMVAQDPGKTQMKEVVQNSQANMDYIKLVLQVLLNTTSVSLTNYDNSIPMIDIKDAITREFTHLENQKTDKISKAQSVQPK